MRTARSDTKLALDGEGIIVAEKGKVNGTCLGVDFIIDGNYRFYAESVDVRKDSFIEMRDAIESRQKAKVATERAKILIAATWTNEGNVIDGIITGIHAGHGKLIAKPSLGSYKNSVFPRVGWIKMALAEEIGLRKRAANIDKAVDEFEVKGYGGYSFKAEMHAEEISRFTKEMEQAKADAEATDLEAQLKKHPYKRVKY